MTLPPIGQAILEESTKQVSQQAGTFITSYPLLGFLLTHWIITLIVVLFITLYIKSKITNWIEAIGDFLLIWTGRAAFCILTFYILKTILVK